MKIERSFVRSESDSKLDFSGNAVDFYAIVNTDRPNQYGEFPGWRLMCMQLSKPWPLSI